MGFIPSPIVCATPPVTYLATYPAPKRLPGPVIFTTSGDPVFTSVVKYEVTGLLNGKKGTTALLAVPFGVAGLDVPGVGLLISP
jgi:hypothetical protein